jgi:hypothetical protein
MQSWEVKSAPKSAIRLTVFIIELSPFGASKSWRTDGLDHFITIQNLSSDSSRVACFAFIDRIVPCSGEDMEPTLERRQQV